jgi:aromatic-L-amino-acid decarboxylase
VPVEGVPEFDIRREGFRVVEWVADYLASVPKYPVMSQVQPGDIRSRLPARPPEHAEPFEAVLADVDRIIMPGVTHWQHPRFFSYFAVTASPHGILAEFLSAALNQVAFVWRSSPAATELEWVAMDWLAQLLGLPAGWHGHIEDTASTSTMAALVAARHRTGKQAVVFSEHAHSSVEKDCRILGLEARKIPTDDEFRMRPDVVAAELSRGDVAAVVATVGTTSAASVDPVPALADLCEASGAWLHVDAAYAGATWVCPEYRDSQAGVERADSLVVNPHKGLLTPMDCSALWSRHPDALKEAFTLTPEYLRSRDQADNLSDFGPALGRRFRALKLWAVIRCYGQAGLQAHIRNTVRLASLFADWVAAEPGWELVLRNFSLVGFRRHGTDEANMAIAEAVNRSGEIFITHTRLADRIVLRLAVGNLNTTEDDIRQAWDVIKASTG